MPEVEEKARMLAKIDICKLKKKLIMSGVFLVAVLVVVGLIFFKGYSSAVRKYENEIEGKNAQIEELLQRIDVLLDEPDVVNPVTPDIVLDVISTEIKEIGELATVNYFFTNAAKFTDSRQIKEWNIPFTEKSFIMKWDGEIRAGVMVDDIEVVVDGMKVMVYIPNAQIFSYSVTNAEVLDEKNNIWNRISIDDKVKFDAKTEQEMKERAIQSGILEEAQESAEKIIVRLFMANTMISEQYTIECKTK